MPKRRDHLKRLCGALNRRGEPCRHYAIPGKTRCRNHGGLSTGPRWPLTAGPEERAVRVATAVENMKAGRRRWLAHLKATGQRARCGRKPKGWSPHLSKLESKAAVADRKRREAPYRRIAKEAEAEAKRIERLELLRGEQRRVDEENRTRADPNVILPDETPEEHVARVACIGERLRRERAQSFNDWVEAKARACGFYRSARWLTR